MILSRLRQVLESEPMQIFPVIGSKALNQAARDALTATGKWQKRNRELNALWMLLHVLAMVILRQQSIPNVFKTLMNAFRSADSDDPLLTVTPEALVHQRERLGYHPLKWLYERMASLFGPTPSFHGLIVSALDGVRFNVPDTKKNEAEYGRPGASRGHTGFPQLLVVALVETTCHFIRDIVVLGCKGSERSGAEQLISKLTSLDLVLLDRGFAAFSLFYRFLESKVNFLCRIPSHWKFRVVRRLGPGDTIVEVVGRVPLPLDKQTKRKKTRKVTLHFRLIEYTCGKEPIRLLTNLLLSDKFPALELAELYQKRWECELAYDEIKNHLATVTYGTVKLVFRSKTPEAVLQEVYALFTVYNLVRQTITTAAHDAKISPLDISFVDALHVIKLAFPRLLAASPEERPVIEAQLRRDIADCRMRRTRRNRKYPRKVKVKMSSFQTKGPKDQQTREKNTPKLLETSNRQ